jgi:DNA-binding LytR/AlgR family response regulator
VICDIILPGTMNGVELAREVRRRRPSAPILLTTGYAGTTVQDAEAEDIEILCKPYAIEALYAALRAAFGDRALGATPHADEAALNTAVPVMDEIAVQ